ncbi:MAG: ribbon-helix-helix domain-containing protein [bacterium]
MSIIPFSTKLTSDQIEALKAISLRTHIPQAVLVRQAVDILIDELSDETIDDFLGLVKKKIKQDKSLLKRLAKS